MRQSFTSIFSLSTTAATNNSGQGNKSSFSVSAGLLVLSLTLCGCVTKSNSVDIPVDIKAVAAAKLNRDVTGKSLSVIIHVYQLKEAGEFSKLTFDMLASDRSDAELLPHDLLEPKREFFLVPGKEYITSEKPNGEPKYTIKKESKYIAVVALFRQPDQHYWRYLIDADQVRAQGLAFNAQDCYLTPVNFKPSPIPGQPMNALPVCDNPNSAGKAIK